MLDVSVDGWDAGDTYTFHVHDCAAGFEEFAGFAGTCGETWIGDFFVFDDEILEHAFAGGDFVEGVEVNVAVVFDVDWSTILLSC